MAVRMKTAIDAVAAAAAVERQDCSC